MAYQEKERAFCFELRFSKCFLHGSQSSTSMHNAQKIRLPTNGKDLQEAGLRESEMLVFEIKVLQTALGAFPAHMNLALLPTVKFHGVLWRTKEIIRLLI